jgi:hypothetical protein
MASGYQGYHISDAASYFNKFCASLLTGMEEKEMGRKTKQNKTKKTSTSCQERRVMF